MKFQWIITPDDEQRYRGFVAKYKSHRFVEERRRRNVQRSNVIISTGAVWECLVRCLLTTQQRSGPGSKVDQFIRQEGHLFSFDFCRESDDLAEVAQTDLKLAGLRRTERIPAEICHAVGVFKEDWQDLELALKKLNGQPDAKVERDVARWIQDRFQGFGPKQSRNLIQWLGLSQYEIPLDSRIMKVLKTLNFPVPLSAKALADEDYYCFILDGLHSVLAKVKVLPCIFDACAFASFERD